MIRVGLGLIFIAAINGATGQQGFVFEGEPRHKVSVSTNSAGVPVRRPGFNPSTIDSIFQIPIAVIQGTSAAAQSWYPQNGETIDKVFDIPVQTLQAVGNLVKDRIPQQPENPNQPTRSHQRREHIMKIRELEIQRRKQELEEQQRTKERERPKRQQYQQEKYQKLQEPESSRTHHSFYNPLAWTEAFADLLVGHGGLFGGHGGHFGGHGNLLGGHGHGDLLGGHRKKKKKKRKPHAHLQQLGGHFDHNHGNLLGGHLGSHGGHGGGGVHQILGGDDHIYQVTETIDEIQPVGPFSWLKPTRTSDPIQNKIAPGFEDHDHSRTFRIQNKIAPGFDDRARSHL